MNVRRISRINCHTVESDKDSAPERISDTQDWLKCNGNLDNPNDREEDCAAYDDSDIEHHNCMEDPQCTEQQEVSAAPNVLRVVRPTRKLKRQPETLLVRVNAAETLRNKGGTTK